MLDPLPDDRAPAMPRPLADAPRFGLRVIRMGGAVCLEGEAWPLSPLSLTPGDRLEVVFGSGLGGAIGMGRVALVVWGGETPRVRWALDVDVTDAPDLDTIVADELEAALCIAAAAAGAGFTPRHHSAAGAARRAAG